MSGGYYTQEQLERRGWTKPLIRKLLSKADYGSGLFLATRVEAAEHTQEFAAARESVSDKQLRLGKWKFRNGTALTQDEAIWLQGFLQKVMKGVYHEIPKGDQERARDLHIELFSRMIDGSKRRKQQKF